MLFYQLLSRGSSMRDICLTLLGVDLNKVDPSKMRVSTENFMKDDCRERISKLELLLEKSSVEKNDMRDKILELTREVAELRVKVEFLEDKNKELLKKTGTIQL